MASETLHVVALPHTQTNGEYATCAYTQRVRKFCRMMTGGKRKVVLYSGDQNDAPCDEHVQLFTEVDRQMLFGAHDLGSLDRGGFDFNNPGHWLQLNANAVLEISSRQKDTDIICLSAGVSQGMIAHSFPQMITAEVMVGYTGIILRDWSFAAFESQSHRAMVYGELGWQNNPRTYDCVIPNQFDPDELPEGKGDGDYILFVGRLIENKGIEVACRVADVLDMKLIVAGPGATDYADGYVQCAEGRFESRHLRYVGPVGIEQRAKLMGAAKAVLVPTQYAEPFGGVAVEAMMCGTPVVTTDFGAFTDTVRNGISGFRYRTLQDAVDATEAAFDLDRRVVRNHALQHYSLHRVAPQYERWFHDLDHLWGAGFNGLVSARRPTMVA